MNGSSTSAATAIDEKSTSVSRKYYHAASRAFLVRDYSRTASHLDSAFTSLPHVPPRQWIDHMVGETSPHGPSSRQALELKRKLEILKITFLATVYSGGPSSSLSSSSPSSSNPPPPSVANDNSSRRLLDLAPDQFIKSLWTLIVLEETDHDNDDDGPGQSRGHSSVHEKGEIVPSRQVSLVSPSIVTSLCLAALKLEQPELSRTIAEAWLGSTTDELERFAWQGIEAIESSRTGKGWATEIPLDHRVASGSSPPPPSLSGSGVLNGSTRPTNDLSDEDEAANEARKQFVKSWVKLLDLLALHISPRLEDWEGAEDLIRLQSVENGGWIPDDRVEATLERLTRIRQEQVETAAARIERQKEVEAHRAANIKREARSSSKLDKGKNRARDAQSPTSSSTGSSPEKKARSTRRSSTAAANGTEKPRGSESPSSSSSSGSSRTPSSATSPTSGVPPELPRSSGFAGLRSSLTSYLSRSSSASLAPSAATSKYPSSSPLTTFATYLRYHYSSDPLRLLSVLCFLLAFSTYLRRRFSLRRASRGAHVKPALPLDLGVRNGMKLIAGKLGETLRMGTKVTTL